MRIAFWGLKIVKDDHGSEAEQISIDSIPRSLRGLLVQIREEHGYKKAAMQRELYSARRLSSIKSFEEKSNGVTNIEETNRGLSYEVLETYARFLKIPVGVLLLVSRYQETDLEEAQKVISVFQEVLGKVIARDSETKKIKDHHNLNDDEVQSGFRIEDLIELSEKINLKIDPTLDVPEPKIKTKPFKTTRLGEVFKYDE